MELKMETVTTDLVIMYANKASTYLFCVEEKMLSDSDILIYLDLQLFIL